MITARVDRSNVLSPRTSTAGTGVGHRRAPVPQTDRGRPGTTPVRTAGRRAPCGTARCAGRRDRESRADRRIPGAPARLPSPGRAGRRAARPPLLTGPRPAARPAGPLPRAGGSRGSRGSEPRSWSASAGSPPETSRRARPTTATGWSGSSSRARRSDASSPAAASWSASDGAGARLAMNSSTSVRWHSPDEAVDHLAVLDGHHRRDRLDLESAEIRGFSSTFTLTSSTAPPVAFDRRPRGSGRACGKDRTRAPTGRPRPAPRRSGRGRTARNRHRSHPWPRHRRYRAALRAVPA